MAVIERLQVRACVFDAYGTLFDFASAAARVSDLLGDKTVVRAGAGLFSYPFYFDAGNQTGFSQPTGIITTTNSTGYYEFLKFEREQQDDKELVALT